VLSGKSDGRDLMRSAVGAPAVKNDARPPSGNRHQRRQRHHTCSAAWVAAAALPIATPFAGMAEAAEAARNPTAADMAAAKRTVLSVISNLRRRSATAAWERAHHHLDPFFLAREP
jgi:hypothetical protein